MASFEYRTLVIPRIRGLAAILGPVNQLGRQGFEIIDFTSRTTPDGTLNYEILLERRRG